MIVIFGLLILVVAAVLAVVGVAANSGGAHPLGGDFTVLGLHLSGLSTGQLFLYGIVVGVLGMLGLSMLLGVFAKRAASRASRRELKGARRETTALRADRDRLTHQLEDEHSQHVLAEPALTGSSTSAVTSGKNTTTAENGAPR